MIRGYFRAAGITKRPYVNALVEFTGVRGVISVPFLIDTGADRSVLSPSVLARVGLAEDDQRRGATTRGIGGAVQTRSIDAVVTLGSVIVPMTLLVFEAEPGGESSTSAAALPSLLGQDVLSRFALVVDAHRDRVLLLEDSEAEALPLP